MRNLIICFFMMIFYISSAHAETQSYAPQIKDERIWKMLAATPDSAIFQRSETVKFAVDFKENDRLYYYNTSKYQFHIDFVNQFIAPHYDHATFSRIEYNTPQRRFGLGSLTHYDDLGMTTLHLAAIDNMSVEMLTKTFRAVQKHLYRPLHFHPQSPYQEEIAKQLPDDIPVTPIHVFQHLQKYRALTLGSATGRLIFIDRNFDLTKLKPDHIVVSDHVPNDIPMVAGLITMKPQAPLSHVSILMSQRQKPNMMMTAGNEVDRWRRWAGTYVLLNVTAQDFSLTPTHPPKKPMAQVKPKIDIAFTPDVTDLRTLCEIRKSDIGAFGGKAGYLGETCQIFPKLPIPDGFAIPVHYYQNHIKNHKIDRLIAEIDTENPQKQLKIIQKTILESEIDLKIVNIVKNSLKNDHFKDKKAFFRSSANIEDLKGFSGAGLYKSKKLHNLQNDHEIATVIKTIWASLWSYRAYQERQNFNMAQEQIAMGILVQPFISDIIASGVAITGNPYTAYRPGYLINAQIIGDNITDNKSNTLPESFILYHYDKELPIRIISRSDLNQHKEIMDPKMRASLATYLGQIQKYFVPKPKANNTSYMDVEFLIDQDGQIIIVQARPYHITQREQKDRVIK